MAKSAKTSEKRYLYEVNSSRFGANSSGGVRFVRWVIVKEGPKTYDVVDDTYGNHKRRFNKEDSKNIFTDGMKACEYFFKCAEATRAEHLRSIEKLDKHTSEVRAAYDARKKELEGVTGKAK